MTCHEINSMRYSQLLTKEDRWNGLRFFFFYLFFHSPCFFTQHPSSFNERYGKNWFHHLSYKSRYISVTIFFFYKCLTIYWIELYFVLWSTGNKISGFHPCQVLYRFHDGLCQPLRCNSGCAALHNGGEGQCIRYTDICVCSYQCPADAMQKEVKK